jgi:hypothetical protein
MPTHARLTVIEHHATHVCQDGNHLLATEHDRKAKLQPAEHVVLCNTWLAFLLRVPYTIACVLPPVPSSHPPYH